VLRTIAGAGHVPFTERPAEFNDALRRFLDSIHW
jgi:pimeloyl-ACP methyl ester carboxylesterase